MLPFFSWQTLFIIIFWAFFCFVDEEDEADDDEDELNELPHLIHTSFVESNEEMSDGNVNEVEETGNYIE